MYKYYYISKKPEESDLEEKLLVIEEFKYTQTITEKEESFEANGYILTKDTLSGEAVENMINKDIFLYNAGIVPRKTKTSELPDSLKNLIRKEINKFYRNAGYNFQITEENFNSFYGSFILEDYHKMIPGVANRLYLISDKDKSPIEKLFDGNYREQRIEQNMTKKGE